MNRKLAAVAGAVLGVSLSIPNASMNGQAPSTDVSLSYSVPSPVTLHEAVSIQIRVVNQRSEPITIDLGKNFIGNSKLVLVKPDGSRLPIDTVTPEPGTFHEAYFPGPVEVEAGSVFTRQIVLNRWADFAAEGTYTLSITFMGTVRSATDAAIPVQRQAVGSIRVLPRNEAALRRACAELTRDAKNIQSAEVSILATTKLTYMQDPIGVECLGRLVMDPAFTVVPIAVDGLKRNGSPQAREALQRLRLHPNADRSRAALDALDWLDREDARKPAK